MGIQQNFGLELPFPWSWDGQRTNSISASQTLDLLRDDIQLSSEGTLFFAHLIVPHDPFIYDSDCQIHTDPISEWSLRGDPSSNQRINSISSRAERYKMYLQQTRCVTKQLHEFFNTMRLSKIYDNATIIIHGDHGSGVRMRRPILANQNDLTSEDILDSFSTLFAVKLAGEKTGYDLRVLSLNQIFSQVAGKIFNKEIKIRPQSPYVNLRIRDADEKKKRSFVRWPYPEPGIQ